VLNGFVIAHSCHPKGNRWPKRRRKFRHNSSTRRGRRVNGSMQSTAGNVWAVPGARPPRVYLSLGNSRTPRYSRRRNWGDDTVRPVPAVNRPIAPAPHNNPNMTDSLR
jgi:hypothetical protein